MIALVAPIGIFLGRVANFINSELYGRETDIIFSGSYEEKNELSIPNHGLITGERITYVPGNGDNKLDIGSGEYFVKKVDIDTIKIARSSSNVDNDIFVSFSGGGTNNKFKLAS